MDEPLWGWRCTTSRPLCRGGWPFAGTRDLGCPQRARGGHRRRAGRATVGDRPPRGDRQCHRSRTAAAASAGGAGHGETSAGVSAADGPTAALRSLADHPWVMEPGGTAARHWAMALCRSAGFEPDVRFETTDLLLHQRLVELDHAAAFLPGLVRSGQAPTVTLRPLPRGRRTRRIFTVVRQGSGRHPAVLACRDALRRAAGLHSRPG
ncbi:LysR substrate-binding domain-containing protein [Streptomyces paradoxus]|uniref:LysR substrate-binding domain-containing protein n=1 Tax=Streptomyces paradoxus TaxID=66375 RepID=UPI0037D28AD1